MFLFQFQQSLQLRFSIHKDLTGELPLESPLIHQKLGTLVCFASANRYPNPPGLYLDLTRLTTTSTPRTTPVRLLFYCRAAASTSFCGGRLSVVRRSAQSESRLASAFRGPLRCQWSCLWSANHSRPQVRFVMLISIVDGMSNPTQLYAFAVPTHIMLWCSTRIPSRLQR